METFRGAQNQRLALHDGQKHYMVTPFDQEVARRAAAHLGLRRYDWLHPGLMYNLFRAFWMQLAPSSLLRTFLLPRAMQVPALEPLPDLPDRYIAVKFYTNDALPSTPDNQRFVRETLKRLTKRAHVVLLKTGLTLDDHVDYEGGEVRVHTVEHLMTPSTNLDIQTRVIASADAFVSTYGGFSYIGPMFGVKTLALYSNPAAFRIDHLEVAKRTFHELRTPPFVTVRTDDMRTLEGLIGSERVAVA
jgi:ADP-heptose:LPS heptosyltransferase